LKCWFAIRVSRNQGTWKWEGPRGCRSLNSRNQGIDAIEATCINDLSEILEMGLEETIGRKEI
jgi:hypothetical protein